MKKRGKRLRLVGKPFRLAIRIPVDISRLMFKRSRSLRYTLENTGIKTVVTGFIRGSCIAGVTGITQRM